MQYINSYRLTNFFSFGTLHCDVQVRVTLLFNKIFLLLNSRDFRKCNKVFDCSSLIATKFCSCYFVVVKIFWIWWIKLLDIKVHDYITLLFLFSSYFYFLIFLSNYLWKPEKNKVDVPFQWHMKSKAKLCSLV